MWRKKNFNEEAYECLAATSFPKNVKNTGLKCWFCIYKRLNVAITTPTYVIAQTTLGYPQAKVINNI